MPGIILYGIGGLGPVFSAIYLIRTTQQKDERREFWRRYCNFKRVLWRWLFASLFIPTLIAIFSVLVARFFSPEYTNWQPLWLLIQNPVMFIFFLVFSYFLDRFLRRLVGAVTGLESFQTKFSALQSSLIVGFFWVIWHIPLFLHRPHPSLRKT